MVQIMDQLIIYGHVTSTFYLYKLMVLRLTDKLFQDMKLNTKDSQTKRNQHRGERLSHYAASDHIITSYLLYYTSTFHIVD